MCLLCIWSGNSVVMSVVRVSVGVNWVGFVMNVRVRVSRIRLLVLVMCWFNFVWFNFFWFFCVW